MFCPPTFIHTKNVSKINICPMAEWLALQTFKHGDSGSYPAEVENFSEEFSVCECVSVCVCSREQDIKGRDVFIGICSSA